MAFKSYLTKDTKIVSLYIKILLIMWHKMLLKIHKLKLRLVMEPNRECGGIRDIRRFFFGKL
jgi:hypothetical protein